MSAIAAMLRILRAYGLPLKFAVALIAAAEKRDMDVLKRSLGPGTKKLLSSGGSRTPIAPEG